MSWCWASGGSVAPLPTESTRGCNPGAAARHKSRVRVKRHSQRRKGSSIHHRPERGCAEPATGTAGLAAGVAPARKQKQGCGETTDTGR